MVITMRYIDEFEVREDVFEFRDCFKDLETLKGNHEVHSLTGKNLALIVTNALKKTDIDFKNMVGACTDGASPLTSLRIGAVAYLKGN